MKHAKHTLDKLSGQLAGIQGQLAAERRAHVAPGAALEVPEILRGGTYRLVGPSKKRGTNSAAAPSAFDFTPEIPEPLEPPDPDAPPSASFPVSVHPPHRATVLTTSSITFQSLFY